MRLFSPDLFRNFAIGFALGGLLVVGVNAEGWSAQVAPPAQAASLAKAPQPSAEFVILPEGTA
ncbi:MAG: hypothetical protein GC147_12695 [Porphyrobacter sp.]|nr:hypothetical protein [Porphyrobacter sp.]